MMNFKKFGCTLLSAACLAAASIGALEAKEIKVATNPTFPPFEFINSQTHEYVGYEMDLIRAVGKHLGYDVKIVSINFDGIIPALLTGTVDVAATGMNITPERAKKVIFSQPIYHSGLTMLVSTKHADEVKTPEDLKGKPVAVQLGTTAATKAKELGAVPVNFQNASEVILDLTNGNTVAAINDKPVTQYILKQRPDLLEHMIHVEDVLLTADDVGMATSKQNAELMKEINATLDLFKKNGVMDELFMKWFGTKFTE